MEEQILQQKEAPEDARGAGGHGFGGRWVGERAEKVEGRGERGERGEKEKEEREERREGEARGLAMMIGTKKKGHRTYP